MISGLRPTAVNRVLQEIRQVQAEGSSVLSLMRGQPDTKTPRPIVEAAERALRAGRTGYPDNRGERVLRDAVAEKLHRDGLQYEPSEILVTDGATAGLYAALVALLDGSGDVLLPDPIYDAYNSPIVLAGGRAVPVRATLEDGRFVLSRAALEAACTAESRVLLLNTPWNPVGTVLRRGELEEILDFAATRDLAVISDEIYEALVYDDRQHVSPAAVGARDRVVLVNSLSKTYSMTGWRVGYCAGKADIIGAMFLVLQQFSRGPATFVQDAAACALVSDQGAIREAPAEFQHRRDLVVEALQGIPGVTALVPEGGLFVMADVRGLHKPSDEIRRFLLREAGVAVLHGSAYGPGGEGLLRVSFAAGGEPLNRGLVRLRDGLLRLGK